MIARIQVSSLLLGLWVFGSLGLSHAATYYVDFASGNNANNGTSTATPWKHSPGDASATGTAAATTLSAGDTVKFKGGVVYRTGPIDLKWSGATNNPIVYDGNHSGDWGTGRAVIDRDYESFTLGGGGVDGRGVGFRGRPGASFLTFLGFEVRNIGGYADDDPVFDLHCSTNPVTVTPEGYGFMFYDVSTGRNTNLRFENLYMHRIGQWRNTQPFSGNNSVTGGGITIRNPNWLVVTNCEFTKMKVAVGLYTASPDHAVENIQIVDIDCHNYMQWPIDIAALTAGARFENINIHDSQIHDYHEHEYGNWQGCGDPPHTDGIFFRTGGRVNTYWTNVNVFNCEFYADDIGNSVGGTASIYISEGPSVNIYNNVFWNSPETRVIGIGHGHYSTQPQTVRIMNNTFYGPQKPLIMAGPTTQATRKVYIWNNLFVMPAGGPANGIPLTMETSGGALPIAMDYNLYWAPDWSVTQKYLYKNVTDYHRLATLRSALGYEINGQYADPLTVNLADITYALSNLRLQSGSQAIGRGTNLSVFFSSDKAGQNRPLTGAWDIGAYQYRSGSLPLPEPPAAVTSLVASLLSSLTQADLTWTDNATNETGFKIERRLAIGGSYVQIATVGPNVVSYRDSGLLAGTLYTYRVRATNEAGDSPYSNEATTTSTGFAAAPSGLAATAVSGTQIGLNWTDNANNETGFKIERSLASGSGFAQIQAVAANTTTFGDANLTPGTTYYYRVRATNGAGDSAYSSVASATTPSARGVGTVGLMLDASEATLVAPYELKDGAISQNSQSLDLTGGKATFLFDVVEAGDYYVAVLVDAPSEANNSVFINVDAEPLNPASVWHIPLTVGFQERVASWQGSGTWDQPQFVPKFFTLTAGQHEVVLRNREPNTRIKSITIQKRAAPPVGDPVVVGP